MKAIVLSFEHLPITAIGCYGSEWVQTPHFDVLAANSVVFDNCYSRGPHGSIAGAFADVLDTHDNRDAAGRSCLHALRSAGVRATMLAESPLESVHREFADFDRVAHIDGLDGFDVASTETPIAQLTAEACRIIQGWPGSERDELLWLSSRGVPVPWMPPVEFSTPYAAILAEEEEEQEECEVDSTAPLAGMEPELNDEADSQTDEEAYDQFIFSGGAIRGPEFVDDALDADEWDLSLAAFAGYVSLLDHWLGMLLQELDSLEEDWLLVVLGHSGLALEGIQGKGANTSPLREEQLHVPCCVTSQGQSFGRRRGELATAANVFPTLLHWFSDLQVTGSLLPALSDADLDLPEYICHADGEHRAIRTPEFLLLVDAIASDAGRWLYDKPEDFWEIHDVADQRPDVVESLLKTLHEFEDWREGQPARRPSLESVRESPSQESPSQESPSQESPSQE